MPSATTPSTEPSQLSVSVVIPVFNGAETIAEVVDRSREVLRGRAVNHEFILVNDGSVDDSWERVVELSASAPDVRGIDLARNYGQHNALLAGIREARCDVVVTIDDDLQNPPEEIPKLLDALTTDWDVVYGEPIAKRQGIGRRMATRVIVRSLGFLGGKTAPMVSSFRAFRTDLREGFSDYTGPDVSIDGLLTWRTERFRSVPVRHDPRVHGESNYSLTKLVRHALTMITAFSTRPLRMATTLGFFVILFGAAVLLYVLLRFLIEGHSVPGFPFLASIISIFSGAQLFAIGVIGEYLARMHVRVMSRPSYSIRARTTAPSRSDPDDSGASSRQGEAELCRMLEWDSEFWGFPIARVIPRRLNPSSAERVERWCDRDGVRCAYLLADAADAETAAAAGDVGFRLVDTRVTLEHLGDSGSPVPSGDGRPFSIRTAEPRDEAGVTAIARTAHSDTRFFFDPGFDSARAGEMYALWACRGLNGDAGRTLLIAEWGGDVVGYLLLGEDPHRIDLIAVAESARGSGVGAGLVAAALERAPDGVTRVVTQARNVAAMRLYQASGFKVTATETWFHRWS